jgi:hypothetical protein
MKARGSLDQLLERCLQELSRSGDVETSLRRYPQHADRLRPLLEMAQATRRYYEAVPEAPGGLVGSRERLLAVAAQRRARGVSATSAIGTIITQTGSRKTKLVFAMKFIGVLLAAVVGLTALGGGVVWTASDSLPGDLLYPIKLAAEDARLALASASGDQVNLALQFAEERAEEMQALVEAGRQFPDETIARMEWHIERALTQAAWATDGEITGLLMRIAERTRTQAQMLEQVQTTASQRTQAGLARAVTVCQWGAEAAENGLSDPQTFRWRYQHRQGTPKPTNGPGWVTVTPRDDQEQEQERHPQREQEREGVPVGTPHMTPQGPQATPELHVTPRGPQATSEPQATPQGPQATFEPQATPYRPQATFEPQATPQGPQRTPAPPTMTPQPQQPGDGRDGEGQDGSGQSGSGQGGDGQGGGRQGDGRQSD